MNEPGSGARDYAITDDMVVMLLWQQNDPPLQADQEFSLSFTGMRVDTIASAKMQPDASVVTCNDAVVAAAFDDGVCLVVGTTGDGLTPQRARTLRVAGVFATGISLDSANEAEHDRLRHAELRAASEVVFPEP